MDILILEDTPERMLQFMDRLKDHHVEICNTPKACIELLRTRTWDWLFLDHDLGPRVGEGYEVADWLEEHVERYPKFGTVIHSQNTVGAARIYMALPGLAWTLPNCWDAADLPQFLESLSVVPP